MGWLGWSYDRTLDTPMQMIILAHEGRVDMLKACFGSSEQTDEKPIEDPKGLKSMLLGMGAKG